MIHVQTVPKHALLPFFADDVLYGQAAHIGLCTLWTPRRRYVELMPSFGVCGNLYSRFGIGILIRNVLANPHLEHIVVTGKDSPEASRHNGNALLTGSFAAADIGLDPHQVQLFYQRTHLHDARSISVRQQDELQQFLATLPPTGRSAEPLVIPLPEIQRDTFPTARSGHQIRASRMDHAHVAVLREIRTFGGFTERDERGHQRQELWQMTVCLDPSTDWQSTPASLYQRTEVERYGASMWNGDEPEDVTYRYGALMRKHYGDQIQTAIDLLRQQREQFRTVITLWQPQQAMLQPDGPCLILVHPRIRQGQLDLFAYLRSNDMWLGWPMNAAGLRYLQQQMAQELAVPVGSLTTTSGSAHVYDYDLTVIDRYLAEQRGQVGLSFDPKGDWHLYRAGSEYVAEHYANGLRIQTLRAPTTERLEQLLAPFLSDVSHALYLGRELQKLETTK
ncbi:MAG: hypothetical protein HC837_04555 [Chloroflexaceae bacterium]|nr:hypothetical protein [Chloroflexaceae bacterium]